MSPEDRALNVLMIVLIVLVVTRVFAELAERAELPALVGETVATPVVLRLLWRP